MGKNKRSISPSRPTHVVAYVRVSTEQQAVDGSSLDAQKAQLEAYAQAFGLVIVAFELDAGASAATTNRPALQRALARLEAGEAQGLLVSKLDRLSRSLRDMCELMDTHFKDRFSLMSVSESIDTGTLTGRLILNVLMSVAEWEREAAAERTALVMANMKAQGKFTGGWPPFGWKLDEDGSLIEVPTEQETIHNVRELHGFGNSLRQIAKLIAVNPDTGKPFSASAISRMLASAK